MKESLGIIPARAGSKRVPGKNIKEFPKAVDDQTLDYTYNFSLNTNDLNTIWFDKSYCRYKWWIFSKPIINHPDKVTLRTEDSFEKITKKKLMYLMMRYMFLRLKVI